MPEKKKRKYAFKKDRFIPIESDNPAHVLDKREKVMV
jgi:hypothetical protein